MSETIVGLTDRVAVRWPDLGRVIAASLYDQTREPLSFYRASWLWQLRTGSVEASRSLRFVDDGMRLVMLDGALAGIAESNRAMGLVLNDANVCAYTRFFFANVGDGKLIVVESAVAGRNAFPANARLNDSAEQVLSGIAPVHVTSAGRDHWLVRLMGLWQSLLVDLEVQVARDGTVAPTRRELLATLAQSGR